MLKCKMLKYFLAVIVCAACIFALSGCSNAPAQTGDISVIEEPITDAEEPVMDFEYLVREIQRASFYERLYYMSDQLLAEETKFIVMLNDFGLDWVISPRQETNHLRTRDDVETYLITCSQGLVSGFFKFSDGGEFAYREFGSRNYLFLAITPERLLTENEIDRLLLQSGLLTDEQWDAFWNLSGTLLEREGEVANIAERSRAFMEGYGRDSAARLEHTMTSYYIEGMEGTVKYRFGLGSLPVLGLYRIIIELGVI